MGRRAKGPDARRGPVCSRRLVRWASREQGALEARKPPPNVPRRVRCASWVPVSMENSGFSAPGQCLCDLGEGKCSYRGL